jgi:ribosomal protein S24E
MSTAPTGQIFMKFDTGHTNKTPSRAPILEKIDKTSGTLHEDLITVYVHVNEHGSHWTDFYEI